MMSRYALRLAPLALLSATLVACSSDGLTTLQEVTHASGTSGTRADSAPPAATPNAVAGIRIAPRAIALVVGASTGITVLPVDAQGVPSLALLAGRPTWRVADATIATVGADSGLVTGRRVGTTMLYATVGTYVDSAAIVVTSGQQPLPTQTPGLHVYAPASLGVGRTAWITAILVDAEGRVVSLRGKSVAWQSSDAAVARVADTQNYDTAAVAAVIGVAAGSARLTATVDGVAQTVALTIVGGATPTDTVRTPIDTTPSAPPPAPVAAFDLTTFVYGAAVRGGAAASDTVPTPLAGVTVTVFRLVRSDAGAADTAATRQQVAVGVTDASGQVAFRRLAQGTYVVTAAPPAGSAYVAGETMFGPPRAVDQRVAIVLARR